MRRAPLPFVDEHTILVEAPPDEVWRALSEALDRAFSRPAAARYASVVGCADRTASGPRPPVEGSTFPAFRAVTATPGRELALHGRHRFSSYAWIFRLDPAGPGHTRLRAETRATFPGPAGGLYRLLVLGTGSHVRLSRRLLASVRHRAEHP
ncbi:SRPBCC family protein [Streptomyces adelaidensis]|uniref:SRPBCC family protein n=1 Tax=Streptomyces adelaidensis TaxID=2796465 RepID=UPI0019074F3D|nr:SRPBCC family protein [Streptomyces adelaidensis]